MGVIEDKENIEICPTNNAADETFEVRAETEYGGRNNEFTISGSGLLCEITYLLVRKHHEFHGSKSENTLSKVSVLQPKALHLHYFILKVPFSLQFFGQPLITTIIFQGQFYHLFYQVRIKKTVFLILQLAFVQDSQMFLLPQVQIIVALFLDMT